RYGLVGDAERLEPGPPGGEAVAVGVQHHLGRATAAPASAPPGGKPERAIRHAVHVAHDEVRNVALLDEGVGATVDPHEHGPHVADERTQHREVLLVV